MKSTKLASFFPIFLILFTSVGQPIAAQEDSGMGFLVRASVGYDVIADNLAFGGGAGYYIPLSGAYTEVMVDVFAGIYATTTTSGNWTYNNSGRLVIVAAHYDYMLGYWPGRAGPYALGGAGFFAGSSFWEEKGTYSSGGITSYNSGGGLTSGVIFDLGFGFAFSRNLDARLEVPVLVHFGGLISIPIVAGVVYRF